MAAIPYTRLQFIQRVKRHIANGFPNDAFTVTDNEVSLYTDEGIALQIKTLAYENAKVEGVLAVPEAFLVTFSLPLTKDAVTGYWQATLPQPPLSLPLGYSINRAYFASTRYGPSQEVMPIKAKRVGYRLNMPLPSGFRYWVEGQTMFVSAHDNATLFGKNIRVQMPVSRTSDLNAPMNLPDDILEALFNDVTGQIVRRMQMPKDIVNDDLPASNTNLKGGR